MPDWATPNQMSYLYPESGLIHHRRKSIRNSRDVRANGVGHRVVVPRPRRRRARDVLELDALGGVVEDVRVALHVVRRVGPLPLSPPRDRVPIRAEER